MFITQTLSTQRLRVAILSATAAWLLAACSPSAPPEAKKAEPQAEPKIAAAPAETVPAAADPLKVAFVYVGPVGDGGWTFAHDNGRKAVVEEFGDKVQTSIVESVPEGPDAERVVRDLASQGNTLVFTTSFGFMKQTAKVARDFPDAKFEHATGYKTAANMSAYDSRTYEGAYMAGVLAGKMTKSNVLGVVASVPIPEVIRNINSFTLGAQSTNPDITTKVVWINAWFDPPKEGEAATALINAGADILFQNTDSAAVLQTAEKMGKRGFGWDSDMSQYGPKAHIASAIINWGPYYTKTVRDVLDNNWTSNTSWWGVKENAIDLITLAPDVPKDAKTQLETVKSGLKDGSFHIWKGPIVDQQGNEILAAGQIADDKFLHGITFYVQGVEGKLPGKE